MSSSNPYVTALESIPRGETRSFAEIARLAGRPSGARAAGRAVAALDPGRAKGWHRAVRSDGGFAPDPTRAIEQVSRLRAEGARPRGGETIVAWLRRRRAAAVGAWRGRFLFARDDPRCATLDPLAVEAFATLAAGRERGFHEPPADAARPVRASRAASGRASADRAAVEDDVETRRARSPPRARAARAAS